MEFSLRIEIVKLNNFEIQFFGVIFCFQVPFPGLSEYEIVHKFVVVIFNKIKSYIKLISANLSG